MQARVPQTFTFLGWKTLRSWVAETPEKPVGTEPSLMESDVQVCVPDFSKVPTEVSQTSDKPQTTGEVKEFSSPRGEGASPFHLPADQLSMLEVQRVVVELIVKSSKISSHFHSSCKLKQFSGWLPQPTFEVDYETWCNSVEFCLKDPTIPDSQVVKKIVESLASPAANVIKALGPQALPEEYLTLLDSAYAAVEDRQDFYSVLE